MRNAAIALSVVAMLTATPALAETTIVVTAKGEVQVQDDTLATSAYIQTQLFANSAGAMKAATARVLEIKTKLEGFGLQSLKHF
ncbi:MAG: hypothetical protein RIQ56_192, partial [Candidatus Parcubacteria bacterium]